MNKGIIDFAMMTLATILCLNVLLVHVNTDTNLFSGYELLYVFVLTLFFLAFLSNNKKIVILSIIISVVFSIYFPQIKYYTYWWFESDKGGHVYLVKYIIETERIPQEMYSSGYSLWPGQFIVFVFHYLITGISDTGFALKSYSLIYLVMFVTSILSISLTKFGKNAGLLITIFSTLFFEIIKASLFMYNFYTLLPIFIVEVIILHSIMKHKSLSKPEIISLLLLIIASIIGTFSFTFVLFLILSTLAIMSNRKDLQILLIAFSAVFLIWNVFIAGFRAIPPFYEVLKSVLQIEFTASEMVEKISHRPFYLFIGMVSQILFVLISMTSSLIFLAMRIMACKKNIKAVAIIIKNPVYTTSILLLSLFTIYLLAFRSGMNEPYRIIIGALPLISVTIFTVFEKIFSECQGKIEHHKRLLLVLAIISAIYSSTYLLSNAIRFNVDFCGYNPAISVEEVAGLEYIYMFWNQDSKAILACEGLLHAVSHLIVPPNTVTKVFGVGGVHGSESLFLFSRFFVNNSIMESAYYTISNRMLRSFPYAPGSYTLLDRARALWWSNKKFETVNKIYDNGDLRLVFSG